MSFIISIITGLLMMGNKVEQLSSYRQLFIFGKEQNQLLVQQQLQLLSEANDGVKERDIKVIVTESENAAGKKYKVEAGQFTVILIGKDGSEKYRTNKLLQTKDLFSIIDAMPMRKSEMSRRKQEL